MSGFFCPISFYFLYNNLCMINSTPQVTAFLKENFTPATLETATLKLSSSELLSLLFNVFPEGSIDDYDLFEILTNLSYKPFKQSFKNDKTSDLSFVWCLMELSETKV